MRGRGEEDERRAETDLHVNTSYQRFPQLVPERLGGREGAEERERNRQPRGNRGGVRD